MPDGRGEERGAILAKPRARGKALDPGRAFAYNPLPKRANPDRVRSATLSETRHATTMSEEPEQPVEEVQPEEELDESERAYREMQKLFEELSFRERWRRMMAGLKMPKDSGEYKFARLQLQRLSGPAVAIAVPLITVVSALCMEPSPVMSQYKS